MAQPSSDAGGSARRRAPNRLGKPRGLTVAALTWCVGLILACSAAAGPTPARSAETLTPAAIAAFEQKLSTARDARADIANRVTCFEEQDRRLVLKRDDSQRRLGALVATMNTLTSLVAQQAAEQAGFQKEYDDEVARSNRMTEDFRNQVEEGRRCNATWTILSPIFCTRYAVASSLDAMQNGSQQFMMMQNTIHIASTGLNGAGEQLRQSQTALSHSQAEAADVARQITAVETSIVHSQATLSKLRDQIHASKTLLDEFADALKEAGSVETSDGRARTARKVRTLADRVDNANHDADALVTEARTVLAEQQLTACFR